MSHCCFSSIENNEIINCKMKHKYGNYCYKHRHNYLLNDEGYIDESKFTGVRGDYLKEDLFKYTRIKMKKRKYNPSSISKNELFQEVHDHIQTMKSINDSTDIDKVIYIQSLIRGKLTRKKLNTIQCNNDEDFYTYDLIKDIPVKYFYSYVDDSGFRWGFDIRSLEKLLSMGYPNPYTTEELPESIISYIKERLIQLKKDPSYENLTDTIERDRKETIKQRIVDICSLIEQSGHTCQIEWFSSLRINKLKELYRQLEDIWNYRAQLSEEMKCKICPPNANIFKTPMVEVLNYNCKEELQELILHEINKFNHAENISDRNLGFMYFLIALSRVSKECYDSHIQWIVYVDPQ